eukprot:582153-Rhodomonas_salina.1
MGMLGAVWTFSNSLQPSCFAPLVWERVAEQQSVRALSGVSVPSVKVRQSRQRWQDRPVMACWSLSTYQRAFVCMNKQDGGVRCDSGVVGLPVSKQSLLYSCIWPPCPESLETASDAVICSG